MDKNLITSICVTVAGVIIFGIGLFAKEEFKWIGGIIFTIGTCLTMLSETYNFKIKGIKVKANEIKKEGRNISPR